MIDFSCADEVIAKLLLSYGVEHEAYFVFRGMTEDHWDAIETVLERHGLALIAESEGRLELMGVLDEPERRAWEAIRRRGRAEPWELVADLGESEPGVRRSLERLWRRRLIMRFDDCYMPVGEVA